MQNIEVSEGLTIGGAPPLKQDAIDKLQNQIIAPIQYLWVDSIDGNDNNDGLTASTPVETLDKAVSLINPDIPEIYIRVTNARTTETDKNYSYHLSKAIVSGSSNQRRITITLKNWYNDYKKPTLTIDVSRVRDGGVESANYYVDGTIIISGFENVTIAGLAIDTTQNFEEKDGNTQLLLFKCSNLDISNTNLKMNNGFIIANNGNVNLVLNAFDTRETTNSYLFSSQYSIPHIKKNINNNEETVFTPDDSRVYCITQTMPGSYRPNGTNNKFLYKTAVSIYPVITE